MSGTARQNRATGLAYSLSNKIAAAESWPANWVAAGGLVLFVAAWTFHGVVAGTGRTLHFDVYEAYSWGKEFQLGYNQHGPFWAWVAGVWFLVFPVTKASFVLLEALNAGLGLLGAWMLAGLFAKGPVRHAAALLLFATQFYTMMAFRYNANTIFVSLWPWTLYFFVKSVDDMRMRDAALFGAFAAACILSKYYAAILLLSCGLALFYHLNGRKYVFSALPWVAAAVFTALVLPHAIWALTSGAPPVNYAMSLIGKGWLSSIGSTLRFLLEAVLNNAGVLALLLLAWLVSKYAGTGEPVERLPRWRRRFLAVLVLAPPLLTAVFGLAFQLGSKLVIVMAVGIFPLVPLYLMQFVAPLDARRSFQIALAVAAVVTVATVAAAPLEGAMMAKKGGPTIDEPRQELAEAVTVLWRAETNTPLRYAGARYVYASAISFYSPDHPSAFIEVSYPTALWVTPEKIKRYGLLIACTHEDSVCFDRAAAVLTGKWKQVSITVAHKAGTRRFPEVAFDIFIMPPQPG
jgi:hypothetical protein